MAEAESEEAVRLRFEAFEMLLENTSSIALPASIEHMSSYFLSESLAEMVNEDPIRLQNQSCVIREEIVKTGYSKPHVYSSLARLPTFSIGLSSTEGEARPGAPLRGSSVDTKVKSPPRYFQMPELGARVFVGDNDGFDTITCDLLDKGFQDLNLDSEYAAVRALYTDDRSGGLRGWLREQPAKFLRSEAYLILSGTELFVGPGIDGSGLTMVGNPGGTSSRVSGSSSDYKDCTGDETIRQPSDIVEQPGDPVTAVHCYWPGQWESVEGRELWRSTIGSYLEKPKFMKDDPELPLPPLPGVRYWWSGQWESVGGPDLCRSTIGSYLEKPKFMKRDNPEFPLPSRWDVLQLTRFDDFVILGNWGFDRAVNSREVIDIVRKNASETADVIAAQLVKSAVEKSWLSSRKPITAIVIFLDHKEILQREHKKEKKENMAPKDTAISLGLLGLKGISPSTVLRDDKKIGELKEDEKTTTLKEEEKIFVSEMEDKKGIMMEDKKGIMMEDHKVKILGGEPLPNVPPLLLVSFEENELGLQVAAISSNLTRVEVPDNSEASSSATVMEDDWEDSHHLTKWIICGDELEKTLLCVFNNGVNLEEMQYEFFFEDHESMATIIGLGVPHSKVVLKPESARVIVVEIPAEDWDDLWTRANDIPPSIPKGYILKRERFPAILHRIASVISINNIVSKANINGGVGGDNGKSRPQGDADDGKGTGEVPDHVDHGSTGHLGGGPNGPLDENDNKDREEKDGNDKKKEREEKDEKKDGRDREDGGNARLRFICGCCQGEFLRKRNVGKIQRRKQRILNLRGLIEGVVLVMLLMLLKTNRMGQLLRELRMAMLMKIC